MAVPGSGGELQAPDFVCGTCGALFHHLPEACLICSGTVRSRSGGGFATFTQTDARRRRILFGLVGFWTLMLSAMVAWMALYDPTLGHAGHIVYPDATMLENLRRGTPPDPAIAFRTFRLSKKDRIEKVGGPPEPVPEDVWIRVTGGPHTGRTGVIVW